MAAMSARFWAATLVPDVAARRPVVAQVAALDHHVGRDHHAPAGARSDRGVVARADQHRPRRRHGTVHGKIAASSSPSPTSRQRRTGRTMT